MAKTLQFGSAPLTGKTRLDVAARSVANVGDFDFDAFHRLSAEAEGASAIVSTDPLLKLEPAPHRPNEVSRISNTLLGIEGVEESEAPERLTTEFDDRIQAACAETELAQPATDEFARRPEVPPDEFGDLDFGAVDFTDDSVPAEAAPSAPRQPPEFASAELFSRVLKDVLDECYPITIAELVRRINDDDSLEPLQTATPYMVASEAREVFNYQILPKVNELFDRIKKGGVVFADELVTQAPTLAAHAAPQEGMQRQTRVALNKSVEVRLPSGVTATLQVYRNSKKLFESERQPEGGVPESTAQPATPLAAQPTPGLPPTAPAIPQNVVAAEKGSEPKAFKRFVEPTEAPQKPVLLKLPATELVVTFSIPIFRVTVPNLNATAGEPPTRTIFYRHLVISNDIHDGLVRDAAFERQKRIRRNFSVDDNHNDGTAKKPYPHLELLLLDPILVKAMSIAAPKEPEEEQSSVALDPINVLFLHQNFKDGVNRRDAQVLYVLIQALNAALQKA